MSFNVAFTPTSSTISGFLSFASDASGNGTYAKIDSTTRTPRTPTTPSSPGQTYYYEAIGVDSGGQESARSTPPVEASIP
jgi:fibronectin type 3 domain-containing protein